MGPSLFMLSNYRISYTGIGMKQNVERKKNSIRKRIFLPSNKDNNLLDY